MSSRQFSTVGGMCMRTQSSQGNLDSDAGQLASDCATVTISLEGKLQASDVESFRSQMAGAAEDAPNLRVDARGLELIDTPNLQVLLALAKFRRRDNESFKLIEPSDALEDAMKALGLGELYGEWRS